MSNMNIQVTFLDGSQNWQDFISQSAQTVSDVLGDSDFIDKVRNWKQFDFTQKSPGDVADALVKAGIVSIKVGFYHNPLGLSIAKEKNGAVFFNTAKRNHGAGSPGNVAHEVMHVLGFSHDGDRPTRNANTIPYRIGEWVDEMLTGPAAHVREA